MIAKHLTYTFTVRTLALCLLSDQWFWNLYFTNNNIISKYIVLSNIISVVSDNILRRYLYSGTPLDTKKNEVLLHTLSAYNSLLVRYKVYSSDPRECLRASWRYAEAYDNFSIDAASCRKNPIQKNKIVILNCQPLPLAENYTEIKAWQRKFAWSDPYFYEKLRWNKSVTAKISLVRNVLKENKLWNRTFKPVAW